MSGATESRDAKYSSQISKSVMPDCSNSPLAKDAKLSPPAARKLSVATRYSAAGSISSPSIVTDTTRSPRAASES